MKKLASKRIALLSVILISLSHADAQQLSINTSKNPSESEIPDSFHKIRYTNDVTGRVLRSFEWSFGDKPGVMWAKTTENLFVAYYKENNRANYVYFSNSGAIDYTLSHYSEDQLSKDVRHIIKSNFYDYSITNVSEVHKNNSVWFFVTVMDKSSAKLIRVTEGEWEVIEDLVRQ